MGKDPAVLFYTSDFLSGTAFFTMEQRGQYITLLCEQHQAGFIPEDHLLKITGSLETSVAKKFVKNTDGTWFNVRMKTETDRRTSFCNSRRKSIDKRWNKNDKPLSDKKINSIRTNIHTDIRMETRTRTRNENTNSCFKKKNFLPPKYEEVENYFLINRFPKELARRFFEGYAVADWKDSKGNSVKNWKQKAIHVWFKPESKIKLESQHPYERI